MRIARFSIGRGDRFRFQVQTGSRHPRSAQLLQRLSGFRPLGTEIAGSPPCPRCLLDAAQPLMRLAEKETRRVFDEAAIQRKSRIHLPAQSRLQPFDRLFVLTELGARVPQREQHQRIVGSQLARLLQIGNRLFILPFLQQAAPGEDGGPARSLRVHAPCPGFQHLREAFPGPLPLAVDVVGVSDAQTGRLVFWMIGCPTLHQPQVIVSLPLADLGLGIPRVAHLHAGVPHRQSEPLQRGHHRLVHRPLKADLREVGEHLDLPKTRTVGPFVDQREIECLVRLSPLDLAHLFPVDVQQIIVGVQPQNPVAGGQFERFVARCGKIVAPGEMTYPGTVATGDLHGLVGRPGVYHDEFVGHFSHALQTAAEYSFFVPGDDTDTQPPAGIRRRAQTRQIVGQDAVVRGDRYPLRVAVAGLLQPSLPLQNRSLVVERLKGVGKTLQNPIVRGQ